MTTQELFTNRRALGIAIGVAAIALVAFVILITGGGRAPQRPQDHIEGTVVAVSESAATITVRDTDGNEITLAIMPTTELHDASGTLAAIDRFTRDTVIAATGTFTSPLSFIPATVTLTSEPALLTYTNPALNISFQYPRTWRPDPRYATIDGVPTGVIGPDGFFTVDALSSVDVPLDDVVNGLVNIVGMPYGKNPKRTPVTIDGQQGTYILSTTIDQNATSGAALVLRYPRPITLKSTSFYYFLLSSDALSIEQLGQTITFLK